MSDARLRLAGFPLAVRPSVLLLIAALGWSVVVHDQPLWLLACYVSALLASVLLHELGHAYALRIIGVEGQTITVHGLGGQVEWDGTANPLSDAEQLFVSLAGPLSGLMVGILALAAVPFAADVLVLNVLGQVVFINLVLNLGNLLPAIPLDGGWALLAFLNMLTPRGWRLGAYAVVYVGSVAGTFLVIAGYHLGNVLMVIIGGQVLLSNVSGTEHLLSGPK